MFCSKCGAENAEGARFCAKCGTGLAAVAPVPPPVAPPSFNRMPEPVSGGGAVVPGAKLPWLALLLSFLISGLGQFYNNDWKKGAVMLVGAVLGLFITGGIATVGIWVWAMIDAYRVADGKGRVW